MIIPRLVRFALLVAHVLAAAVVARAADAQIQPAEIGVMSFNIRYGTANDGTNSWPNRRALVGKVLATFRPTVLGVQEALAFQLREIDAMLPGYARVGVGRDDGNEAGEYTAIFFDASKLELLANGTFWFSESAAIDRSNEDGRYPSDHFPVTALLLFGRR